MIHTPKLILTKPAKILAGAGRPVELRGEADKSLLAYRVVVRLKP